MLNRSSVILGSLALIGIIIVVYGTLAIHHVDTNGYLALTSPMVVVLLANIAIGKQVDDVKKSVNKVENQTNGKLNAKFNALHDRLDKAGIPPADPALEAKGNVGEDTTP